VSSRRAPAAASRESRPQVAEAASNDGRDNTALAWLESRGFFAALNSTPQRASNASWQQTPMSATEKRGSSVGAPSPIRPSSCSKSGGRSFARISAQRASSLLEQVRLEEGLEQKRADHVCHAGVRVLLEKECPGELDGIPQLPPAIGLVSVAVSIFHTLRRGGGLPNHSGSVLQAERPRTRISARDVPTRRLRRPDGGHVEWHERKDASSPRWSTARFRTELSRAVAHPDGCNGVVFLGGLRLGPGGRRPPRSPSRAGQSSQMMRVSPVSASRK
jgi:hypothetical protein